MWQKTIKEQNASLYVAFSLTEMLISLFLGSFLLFLSAQLYVDLYSKNAAQQELFKLQQTTKNISNYIKQNIENIGYVGQDRSSTNYDLFLVNNKAYYLSGKQCFIFFYDVDNDGCIGSKKNPNCYKNGVNKVKDLSEEFFGFKFSNGKMYILSKFPIPHPCNQESCKAWSKLCENSSSWNDLALLFDYQIVDLAFEWKKEGMLMSISLTLKSDKFPNIKYTEKVYSYIMNWK